MNEVKNILKISACICAKDGLISRAEEETMFKCITKRFPEFDFESFEKTLDEFFESEEQIEDYLDQIKDPELQKFTLGLSEVSASADGLDIRENIALKKAYLVWGRDAL